MGKSRRRKVATLTREPSAVKNLKTDIVDDKNLRSSQRLFTWSLSVVDVSSRWGLTADVLEEKWCPKNGLLKALVSRETMTWAQVANQVGGPNRGTNSHHVPTSKILGEARELLEKSLLYDLDEIYSLRIKGQERFYGIIQDYVLYILWYDPKHEICPSS
ncbi:MAG: hypothetical protein OXD43_05065 [Bacteroidetes bacterium]|nr:hypothetical protein [Bacteroidota bacterium]